MDGAGPNDHEQTVVALLNDLDGLVTTRADGSSGMVRLISVQSAYAIDLVCIQSSRVGYW